MLVVVNEELYNEAFALEIEIRQKCRNGATIASLCDQYNMSRNDIKSITGEFYN